MNFEYLLPGDIEPAQVGACLRQRFRLNEGQSFRRERCFFDTFDWRLFQAGQALEERRDGASTQLVWRSLNAGGVLRVLPDVLSPQFARELPAGSFREHLGKVTEPRALLPQAIICCDGFLMELLDADSGKVLARTYVETDSLIRNGSRARSVLSRRLRIEPLRGYGDYADEAARLLRKQFALVRAREDLLTVALQARGRAPGEYCARPTVSLLCDQRSDAAARQLLARYQHVLVANIPGVRDCADSEFLHDLRVAVRRQRTLLGTLEDVFPKRVLGRYSRELSWVGEITGPARDCDVFLQRFDDYADLVSPRYRASLELLRTFLEHEQAVAYTGLEKQMQSSRWQRWVSSWREYLEAPPPRRTRLKLAHLPVRGFADARIGRAYNKLCKRGRAISKRSSQARLHRLRIDAKHLRYLVEAFASLYPGKAIERLRDELKHLQAQLGEFQDLCVHAQTLELYRERMRSAEALPPKTEKAINALIKALRRENKRMLKQLPKQFDRFDRPANQARVAKTFNIV